MRKIKEIKLTLSNEKNIKPDMRVMVTWWNKQFRVTIGAAVQHYQFTMDLYSTSRTLFQW